MLFSKMFCLFRPVVKLSRNFSVSSKSNFKVVVCGGAGGIGQPLALLLKQNTLVTQVSLYDIDKVTCGVAVDLSHINTRSCVDAYIGPDQLFYAMFGAHVVIITAGIGRKPGMTRNDLFDKNAGIVFDMTLAVARYCPCAIICIVTNPLNSMVPVAAEVMTRCGVFDPARIMGVTTLDLVRASTFIAHANCSDPFLQYVPVVGGHQAETIVPLLSQSKPGIYLSETVREKLVKRIQNAGTEVVEAKVSGSATLSMAFACARFADAVMRGLAGQANVIETAYVRSNCTEALYFSTPLVLGCGGVLTNLGIPTGLTHFETCGVQKAIDLLKPDIEKGREFGATRP